MRSIRIPFRILIATVCWAQLQLIFGDVLWRSVFINAVNGWTTLQERTSIEKQRNACPRSKQ